MIHTLYIRPDSELETFKKEFRRCLMTGGAVVRVPDDALPKELLYVRERFAPFAEPHSLAEMVIQEIDAALAGR